MVSEKRPELWLFLPAARQPLSQELGSDLIQYQTVARGIQLLFFLQ